MWFEEDIIRKSGLSPTHINNHIINYYATDIHDDIFSDIMIQINKLMQQFGYIGIKQMLNHLYDHYVYKNTSIIHDHIIFQLYID